MSRLSKKLINKLTIFLLCFIFAFYSTSQSSEKVEDLKIKDWIEDIPILLNLIENKKDVVEFDSSNGKIITISFDIKNLSNKQILSFYRDYFKEKEWKKDKKNNIWKLESKRLKKKVFKIENSENNILTIKIITENF